MNNTSSRDRLLLDRARFSVDDRHKTVSSVRKQCSIYFLILDFFNSAWQKALIEHRQRPNLVSNVDASRNTVECSLLPHSHLSAPHLFRHSKSAFNIVDSKCYRAFWQLLQNVHECWETCSVWKEAVVESHIDSTSPILLCVKGWISPFDSYL